MTKLKGSSLAGGNPMRGREENDYYATNPKSTLALLSVENIVYPVLEPCCGEGHISKLLTGDVDSFDLIFRGYGIGGIDFLTFVPQKKYQDIVTNPPYKLFNEFLVKSLEIATHRVYFFGKLVALEGIQRSYLLEKSPLKYVYVFRSRQQPLQGGSEIDPITGKRWAGNTMAFAWFVWEQGYSGEPIIKWLD